MLYFHLYLYLCFGLISYIYAFKMCVNLTLPIIVKVGKCKDSFGLAAMWGRETNLAKHGINSAPALWVLGKPPFNYEHFDRQPPYRDKSLQIFFEPLQSDVSDHGSNLASARIPSPSHSTEWIPSPPVHCLSSSLEGLQPWGIVSSLSCVPDWFGWFWGGGANHGVLSVLFQ